MHTSSYSQTAQWLGRLSFSKCNSYKFILLELNKSVCCSRATSEALPTTNQL